MNIMVVNDDGIMSRGMRELVDALKPYANVYVCAPDGQRSGAIRCLALADGGLRFTFLPAPEAVEST